MTYFNPVRLTAPAMIECEGQNGKTFLINANEIKTISGNELKTKEGYTYKAVNRDGDIFSPSPHKLFDDWNNKSYSIDCYG